MIGSTTKEAHGEEDDRHGDTAKRMRIRLIILSTAAAKTASDTAVNLASQSRIKNQLVFRVHQEVPGLLGGPFPVERAVIPAKCTPWVPCSMKNSTYRRRRITVST